MPLFSYSFNRASDNWESVANISVKARDKQLENLLQGLFPELMVGFRGKEDVID